MRAPATAGVELAELRALKLFCDAGEAVLEALLRHGRVRHFAAGQCIVSRAATDREVYFVVRGAVRVTAFSAAGRQLTYRDLQAGEWFGEISAIDGGPRSADVYACREASLLSLGASDFIELVRASPAVSDRLLAHLVALVRDLSTRLFEVSTLGVVNRVHAELLRLAKQAGVAANIASIRPSPGHAEIASRVSTTREQVTRELSALARRGIVERVGRTLVVRDVARLSRLVEEMREGA